MYPATLLKRYPRERSPSMIVSAFITKAAAVPALPRALRDVTVAAPEPWPCAGQTHSSVSVSSAHFFPVTLYRKN